MSRNRNDELPDDLIDKLKLLNEQPDDYDADTRPLVPLNEDDIGTFRPPEPALRVGVRDSSYLNYRAWGYISEDERILLSDEGEVYLKIALRGLVSKTLRRTITERLVFWLSCGRSGRG